MHRPYTSNNTADRVSRSGFTDFSTQAAALWAVGNIYSIYKW